MSDGESTEQPKLSWKEGLFLVGPDPLTSPYYSSGALILAGAGYATPAFQIGLYALLFLLAPLYIEAVLLTLSNGGTYVMTRYALSHLGKFAILAAAVVGVVISFSYVATAIVSLLSYSHYLLALMGGHGSGTVPATLLSALPALVFGIWVMPSRWRSIGVSVAITTALAVVTSTVLPAEVVIMLAPLLLLFQLNNYGLKESVRVSKTIFLINIAVMAVTILFAIVYLILHGGHFENFGDGVKIARAMKKANPDGPGALPGLMTLGAAMIPAAMGSAILGASGVESVMNIPEELENPRRDVRRIYRWMLSILLAIGGCLSLLVFLVLPPEVLVEHPGSLLAQLGHRVMVGVTGSEGFANVWKTVIVANAALMLIGATNTGFAGARGLWITMARDELIPRAFMKANFRGAYERIHWLMLAAILLLAWEGDASAELLERWYGATFGLVMFSGVIAFILLRKYKVSDYRAYRAPWNITISGVDTPVAAIIGALVLGFALLGLYARYSEDIGELRGLLVTMAVLVGLVIVGYNHRSMIRAAYQYFRRVIETVESDAIETDDRTIVVAVGGVRIGRLLREAIRLARAQSATTGIPYRQVVVFHMTRSVRNEYVYRVTRDSMRPAGIDGNAIRIFNLMAELAPSDLTMYLALVPNRSPAGTGTLDAAMNELVEFHRAHEFQGHIVMIGDYGVTPEIQDLLQERLQGSTIVLAPT